MRVWCNGSISALQAFGDGSNPFTRSTKILQFLKNFSIIYIENETEKKLNKGLQTLLRVTR